MTTMTVAPRAPAPAAAPPEREANLTALQITGRTHVSYSQLNLMRACPRKFAFTYTEQAPRDFVASSLIYGGAVHAALERYYCAKLEGLSLSASQMHDAYRSAWARQLRDAGDRVPVKYNKEENEEKVHALAQRTFEAFLASPLATPKGTVLAIEEELRLVLDPTLPTVLCKVDLVTMSDSAVYVTDFKTSRSRWTEARARESGDQLILYGVTAASMARHLGLPLKLAFVVLTKAKSPQVQVLPVPTDEARIAVMKKTALSTWAAIQAGNFYPNPSPQSCSTCPFRSRCPVFAGQ
jgi:putative RecB family exonuclease